METRRYRSWVDTLQASLPHNPNGTTIEPDAEILDSWLAVCLHEEEWWNDADDTDLYPFLAL